MTIAEAIAKVEGFGASSTNRPTRNNNPGDIEWGLFAEQHGATRVETPRPHQAARFAYFPDAQTGFSAMRALLMQHYAGMTIADAITKYAPPIENDTAAYIAEVVKLTGLPADTKISVANV